MVTLSLTRSRIAGVLFRAAGVLGLEGWDPSSDQHSLMGVIDRAIGLVPGKGSQDAAETSLAAWEALAAHLGVERTAWEFPREWEQQPGRTEAEVLDALRGAAAGVVA